MICGEMFIRVSLYGNLSPVQIHAFIVTALLGIFSVHVPCVLTAMLIKQIVVGAFRHVDGPGTC